MSVARLAVTSLTFTWAALGVTALGKGAASDSHGSTGKPEPTFHANSPCSLALYPGRVVRRSGPHGVCYRRNLGTRGQFGGRRL